MGIQASLPRKSPKKDRPVRYGVHFWLTDDRQTVLLRTRPTKGLLGGMTELPGTPWRDTPWTIDEALGRRADASWNGGVRARCVTASPISS